MNMTLSRRKATFLLVLLFLVAFFLRAYHPVSWPGQWLERSTAFARALTTGNLARLYQSYHPGVTTMAFGGPSIRLYEKLADSPARLLYTWAIPSYATPTGARVAAAVMGLALVLSAVIVGTALALREIGGWTLALAGGSLLAFEPYFLAYSRVLHLDGMLSALMLLSASLLLASLQTGRRTLFVLSGLAGGLALLTKSPALFLFPYTGLALLVHLANRLRTQGGEHAGDWLRWPLGETWRGLVLPGLLWSALAVVPFALWPPMWIEPLEVLKRIIAQVSESRVTPHAHEIFFAGQIFESQRPSVLFYPTVLAFRSTFVTLTLGLTALGGYTLWRRRARLPVPPVTFWLMVAYGFFYTLQMSLSAKQTARYILPAQVCIVMLAAVGLVWLSELLSQALRASRPRVVPALPGALVTLAVGLQALVTLPFAPDYGAHVNYLLGGNPVAARVIPIMEQNEGISYVGEFLSKQAGVESLEVAVSYPAGGFSLRQYFPGEIVHEMSPNGAYDYDLFFAIADQRHRYNVGAEATWEARQGVTPAFIVSFDGYDYLGLYPKNREAKTTQNVRRGWMGFVVVAWLWTGGLVASLAWALKRTHMACD